MKVLFLDPTLGVKMASRLHETHVLAWQKLTNYTRRARAQPRPQNKSKNSSGATFWLEAARLAEKLIKLLPSLGSPGLPWAPLASPGCPWGGRSVIPLGFPGLPWTHTHLGSPGLPWVPLEGRSDANWGQTYQKLLQLATKRIQNE